MRKFMDKLASFSFHESPDLGIRADNASELLAFFLFFSTFDFYSIVLVQVHITGQAACPRLQLEE